MDSAPRASPVSLARDGLTHLVLGRVDAEARAAFTRRADLAVNLVLRHERPRAGFAPVGGLRTVRG